MRDDLRNIEDVVDGYEGSPHDLGPIRLVKCVRCGNDKWRGPDDVCAICRQDEATPAPLSSAPAWRVFVVISGLGG